MSFLAYRVNREQIQFPGIVSKLEERLSRGGITIRSFDDNHLERDSEIIQHIFNKAWRGNWGFVPVSLEEVRDDFERVKPFYKRDLIHIAEDRNRPIGFSLSLPDINQALKPLRGRLLPFNWLRLLYRIRRISQIRVVLMGVLEEYRRRGVDLLFYKNTMETAFRYNFHTAELSWILENNDRMNRVLEHINAERYKRYAIYEKELTRGFLSSFHLIANH